MSEFQKFAEVYDEETNTWLIQCYLPGDDGVTRCVYLFENLTRHESCDRMAQLLGWEVEDNDKHVDK